MPYDSNRNPATDADWPDYDRGINSLQAKVNCNYPAAPVRQKGERLGVGEIVSTCKSHE